MPRCGVGRVSNENGYGGDGPRGCLPPITAGLRVTRIALRSYSDKPISCFIDLLVSNKHYRCGDSIGQRAAVLSWEALCYKWLPVLLNFISLMHIYLRGEHDPHTDKCRISTQLKFFRLISSVDGIPEIGAMVVGSNL